MHISQWLNFREVDSTNDWIKNNHSNLPVGTCVYTATQRSGRGQGANYWFSPIGGLYFSVLLEKGPFLIDAKSLVPHFSYHAQKFLNQRYNLNIRFKKPNDLYVENSKLMGVLFDNIFMGNTLCASILGVGLNVNYEFNSNSTEVECNAISIRQLIGSKFLLDTRKLMVDLLESYEYEELRSGFYE